MQLNVKVPDKTLEKNISFELPKVFIQNIRVEAIKSLSEICNFDLLKSKAEEIKKLAKRNLKAADVEDIKQLCDDVIRSCKIVNESIFGLNKEISSSVNVVSEKKKRKIES
jgi:hypothetical protein